MKEVNPIIEWHTIENEKFLKFIFTGKLMGNDAEKGAIKWKKIMDSMPDKKISLIWECKKMTGYDSLARSIWQETIEKYKDQISSIWLVTNSIIIQSGAKIISIITTMDVKCVSTIEEIKPTSFK